MIIKGEKKVKEIYKGMQQVFKIYKGYVLWYIYTTEHFLQVLLSIFSSTKAILEKAIAVQIKAIGQMFSGASATVKTDTVEKVKADGKAFSGAVATGDAGHTEKIKADNISFTAEDAILTATDGNIQAEEQHIVSKDIAHAETGKAQSQAAKNHILFTQSVPTASKGEAMYTKKTDMPMHLTDTATGGAGYARPQKAEMHGFFSYVKPYMLAQKIMPEMQEVKAFFKDIVSLGSGHAKPQEATENNIFFTAEKVDVTFGSVLPKPTAQEMHIADFASGGVGYARPQSATAESYFENLAQLTDDTTDVTAVTAAHSGNVALFEKGYGNGIKAVDGGISGSDSFVYKPKKVFKIDNAGGISGADSTVYKPEKIFKTDTLIQSGAFARLFRVVQMSAVTTAKLISKPPLFRYVFLGAEGGGISSGKGLLDKGTYEELFGWAVQYDNVLYIFQSNTASQADNVLSIDTGTVEAWHTQADNVLYINVSSTAEQTETQLEIDMLTQLANDEWAVQTNNALLINGIIDNTEIEVS